MSLRLVLGRAGTGKTRICLEEIGKELRQSPRGDSLLYIVPEQATFQAEYSLATLPGIKGTMRAEGLSFRRLAYKVAQEVGGGQGIYIDDTGKAMVLRKILERRRRDLKVFKFSGQQTGMLENIIDFYNEMKRARVSPEELARIQEKKDNPHLQEKVRDLSLIWEEMDGELSGAYLDAEDYLELLVEKIPASFHMHQARVWVDGFTSFNNQEQAVLEALLLRTSCVTVTLCLDKGQPLEGLPPELDPFYATALTCRQLQRRAFNINVPIQIEGPLNQPPRRFLSPILSHLEGAYHSYPAVPFEEGGEEDGGIKLVGAVHRRAEAEAVARELTALARDRGYRWRDMVVLVGSLDDYQDILATVFSDYEIPFFLDKKRPLLHHPLVEFIRSALEVVTRNWPLDAVFRCAKTDLLLPPGEEEEGKQGWRDKINRLENYCLSFGISGKPWLQETPWEYRERQLEDEKAEASSAEEAYLQEINSTRKQLQGPLASLQKKLRAAGTVEEKTLALYGLLVDVDAPKHLEEWQNEALKRGEAGRVREHFQVYKKVLDLLDQLVEMMGAEKVSTLLFSRILESGLEGLRMSLVPPSLDQVVVGTPDRTETGSVQASFILGVNDGIFPARPGEEVVFTEEERDILSQSGLELPSSSSRQLLEQPFLTYLALTRSSRWLWVSYSLADEEGRGLVPSPIIPRLKALFPARTEELACVEADRDAGDARILSYTAHPRQTLSQLTVKLGALKAQGEINPLWWDIYNWYAARTEWREKGKVFLQGVFYQNSAPALSQGTCRSLYGQRLKLSISRLEKFKACPFAQFAAHGLGLKERRVYRLDAPQIGRFFHTALYRFMKCLLEEGRDLAHLSGRETLDLVGEVVKALIPLLQKEILLSSSRYHYLGRKLEATVAEAALTLRQQALRSTFSPVALEASFGPGGDLPPLIYPLGGDVEAELAGRIDRLDAAKGEDGRRYLRVIDYKTGKTALNINEVWHGLSLQIVAYLDVALRFAPQLLGQEALPAGALYFRVHAPVLKEKGPLSPEEAEEKHFKASCMRGKVLAETDIVRLMDTKLMQGASSPVIPVRLKKDGEFSKSSSILDFPTFYGLLNHVEETIKESAASIAAGDVAISPYRLGQKKACLFCDFKSVCQFDPLVEGNAYRPLSLNDEDTLLQSLCKAHGKKGGKENEKKHTS